MEAKQTAVEWLWKSLIDSGFKDIEDVEGFYYKAKEIEKEQRIKGYQLGYDAGYKVCEMKFNGLFKSE
jgi:hypothetical protein